jgi:hypothetical protein
MIRIFLLTLLLPLASIAQGTFLFTWHGNSNFFQASFVVTAAEMQDGAGFSSPEFTNSLVVNSLSGATYSIKNNETLILGDVNPWDFNFTFVDFDRGMELFVRTASFPIGGMTGSIEEKPLSGSDLFYERGFWTFSEIPEPSTLSLVIVGVTIWGLKKRERQHRRPSPKRRMCLVTV